MSAFGVVMIALGVLMMWSGLKGQKLNEVLSGFIGQPTAKTQSAGGPTTSVQLD